MNELMPASRSTAVIMAPLRPYFSSYDGMLGRWPWRGVDLVTGQGHLALGDDLIEKFRVRAAHGQVLADRLARDVVGRGGDQLAPVALAAAVHHDVAVAHAGVQRHAGQVSVFREVGQQAAAFVAADVARRVVLHHAVDDRDQIHAEDPVAGAHLDAQRRGFEPTWCTRPTRRACRRGW